MDVKKAPWYSDPREKIFIDMDGVLADYEASMDRVKAILGEEANHEEIKRTWGWYLNLPPIPGAIEAFQKLSVKYNTFILSTPSWTNTSSWGDKRIWVSENLGQAAFKKLILCHDKGLFTGKVLIDDRVGTNQPNFNGQHIHFGQEPFQNWEKVLDYLL